MNGKHDSTRVLARCIDCGRTLAANRWPDGSVTFIGQPDGCPCGGTEVRVVTDERSATGVGTGGGETVSARAAGTGAPGTDGSSGAGEPLS